MRPGGPGDERVGSVDGPPPLLESALVAARAEGGFAAGFEEAQALQKRC